jgi:antitoxin ParD1/3/4
MPTRNVNLTKELDQFVASKVKAGRYANASKVMRTALRLLEKEEREYEEKLAALRTAIGEGLASGDAEEGVFERLNAYIEELAMEKNVKNNFVQIAYGCYQPRGARIEGPVVHFSTQFAPKLHRFCALSPASARTRLLDEAPTQADLRLHRIWGKVGSPSLRRAWGFCAFHRQLPVFRNEMPGNVKKIQDIVVCC